ncbi:MAG: PAS domain-containing protein [Proteobacteria bacterium]|nr:PAS domain-containing protein [Pseudomonadota bacterium]MBU1711299.1 PAS domain-containing protein [Pseudomonadota bacterium]
MIDLGLIILDKDLRVRYWNHWLESRSGIKKEMILGRSVLETFPHLDSPKFRRNFKAVFAFGNFYFFPRKLYDYLFPFKPDSTFMSDVDYMQQSCTMGPIRDESKAIRYVFISIKDVTEASIYEKKLTEALFAMLDTGESRRTEPESILTDLFSSSYDNPFAKRDSPPLSSLNAVTVEPQFHEPVSEAADMIVKELEQISSSQDDSEEEPAAPESERVRKHTGKSFVQTQIDELILMIDDTATTARPARKKTEKTVPKKVAAVSKKGTDKTKKSKIDEKTSVKERKNKEVNKFESVVKDNSKLPKISKKKIKKSKPIPVETTVHEQIEEISSIIDFTGGKDKSKK